jgi:hypothetical protein
MHSAPDYNLDAGRVVIGVVISVILIYATSMEQLTPSLCVHSLRSTSLAVSATIVPQAVAKHG